MQTNVSFPPSPSDELARSIDHLWAKFEKIIGDGTFETWTQHTRNTLFVADYVRERYQPLIEREEVFWEQLKIALLFHDAGKFVQNFQRENRKRAAGGKPDWGVYLRHELISTVLLHGLHEVSDDVAMDTLLAVAGHHKPLGNEMFQGNSVYSRLEYEDADLEGVVAYIAAVLSEWEVIGNWRPDRTTRELLEDARTDDVRELITDWWPNEVLSRKCTQILKEAGYTPAGMHERRRYYADFMGALHVCDWMGSGHDLPLPALTFTPDDLEAYMLRTLRPDPDRPFTWKPFQEASITNRNVLAIAPTGSGKTEASLLWASQGPPGGRIIYCLPTKVTSNAIFERLRKIFPGGKSRVVDGRTAKVKRVGVVHSGAKNYRLLAEEDDFEAMDYLQDKSFFRDVTVCTVDQLLTCGFNLGHWQLKSLHLAKASVIIDEIHLFEPYTVGLIVATIRYLSENYGVRFYIMTATMPTGLRKLLSSELGDVLVYRENSLDNTARNEWQLKEEDILSDSMVASVRADLAAGRKVLVVRNTVDHCISTYGKLHEVTDISADQAMCLHSRFTEKDRAHKEDFLVNKLKKLPDQPFLLVATQVVEVSLDIDFDVLYTENAPMDALAQRAGRVNRKRNKSGTRVIVFPATEVGEFVYGENQHKYLTSTWKNLTPYAGTRITEKQLVDLTEELYRGYDVTAEEDYQKGLDSYRQLYLKTTKLVQDINFNEEVFTRQGIDSVTVMPESLWEKYKYLEAPARSVHTLAIRRSVLKTRFEVVSLTEAEQRGTFFTVIKDQPERYNDQVGLLLPPKRDIQQSTGKCL